MIESTAPDTPSPLAVAYGRGETAARLAVRDCPDPSSLGLLHEHADRNLQAARERLEAARVQLRYQRGFHAHLTELRQESST